AIGAGSPRLVRATSRGLQLSNRRRPRLLRVLSFVLGALVVGGAIGPAAFLDTRSMPNRSIAKDAHGVVMAAYGGTLGNQYNPVTISQAAITYYYAAVNSSEPAAQKQADRLALITQANWL